MQAKFWSGNLKERDILEDPGIHEWLVLD